MHLTLTSQQALYLLSVVEEVVPQSVPERDMLLELETMLRGQFEDIPKETA